jgi:hypothetical protein
MQGRFDTSDTKRDACNYDRLTLANCVFLFAIPVFTVTGVRGLFCYLFSADLKNVGNLDMQIKQISI